MKLIWLLLTLLITGLLSAQQPFKVKYTENTFTVDGNLAEKDWSENDSIAHLVQIYNADNTPTRTHSIIRVLQGKHFLYISAVLHLLPDHKQYVASTLKRDFPVMENDAFGFVLNPSGDGINGYAFFVNAYGAQAEAEITNIDQFDYSWDQKWFSAVQRQKDHWLVEIAIPLNILRFAKGANEWKANFIRISNSNNEYSSWTPTPRNRTIGSLAYTGRLQFERPLESETKTISWLPGLATNYVKNYKKDNATLKVNPALDAKIKLSTSLAADITLNSDFSQAEVDVQQANLTRYELNYPEKRAFFLENAGLFSNFGYSGYGAAPVMPFYSRRIGIAYNPVTKLYEQQRILGGARLYGKLNPDLSMGILTIQTDKAGMEGQDTSWTVPAQNYTAIAFQQNVFSRSRLSALFVNRQSFDGLKPLNDYNRVYSLDFNLGSANGNWNGKLFHSGSFTAQKGQSIAFDAQSIAGGGELFYYDRNYLFALGGIYNGKNYKTETGYTPRSAYINQHVEAARYFYPRNTNAIAMQYLAAAHYERFTTLDGRNTDQLFMLFGHIKFKNTSLIRLYLNHTYTWLPYDFDPSISNAEPLKGGTGYAYNDITVNYNSDKRKPFFITFAGTGGNYYNGQHLSLTGTINYKAQPWGIFSLSYNYNRIKLAGNNGSNSIWVLGPRMDFSFSRNLFLTSLVQYNSLSKNLGVYGKLQWRFRPLSDIFLVYQDNYDTGTVLKLSNRAIALKITYWL